MSALPNKPAPSIDPHARSAFDKPGGSYRDARMTSKAGDVPYAAFIAAGWTEAEMRAADMLK